MLPRLSPEIWITTSEYRPDTDSNLDTISTSGEEFPYNPGFRPHGTRSLGRPLFIRANETVCILGKRFVKCFFFFSVFYLLSFTLKLTTCCSLFYL